MKPSPGATFDEQLIATVREVSYTVVMTIDGVETDISQYVKNISVNRSAGDSKVATFTGSISSEATVTISPAEFDFGTNPIRNSISISSGFAGEEVLLFTGMVQRIQKKANAGEAIITCLDSALALTRISVETPALFNVYSTEYMKEILENAGFSSRLAGPDKTIFAFDGDVSASAIISAVKSVSDTKDNGVMLSSVVPHKFFGLNGKQYYYRESERSFSLNIMPSTVSHPTTSAGSQYNLVTNPNYVIPPDNATGRLYLPMPSGYGGGAVIAPTVLQFDAGLFGYEYWMTGHCSVESEMGDTLKQLWRDNGCSAVLAFAELFGYRGDPSVLVSADGTTFATPPFTNPIATRPTYTKDTVVRKYNADTRKYEDYTMDAGEPILGIINAHPTLFEDSGTLYCVWTQYTKDYMFWYYSYTLNGTTWTNPVKWATFGLGQGISPTFAQDSAGRVYAWWTSFSGTTATLRFSALSGTIGSSILELNRGDRQAEVCSFQRDGITLGAVGVWHLHVTPCHTGTGFDGILTTCTRNTLGNNQRPYFVSSKDGRVWDLSPNPIVSPSSVDWDNHIVATGCLVPNVDTVTGQIYDLYYAGANGNHTWGLGRTDLLEELVTYSEVPDSLPKGPISWEFESKRAINGIDSANKNALWAASGGGSKYVSMGGFFTPHTSIDWSANTQKFMLMEADFGSWFKLLLSVEGSNIVARWFKNSSSTWTLISTTTHAMTGDWNAWETMFVGVEVETLWTGTNRTGRLSVVTGVSGVTASRTTGSFSSAAATGYTNIDNLRAVRIVSTFSGTIHSTYFDNTFPGLGYENLSVIMGAIPATIPRPAYVMDRGLNVIHAASYRGTDPWSELRMVCEAELGCLVWDEDGVLRFYNRHHYTHPDRLALVDTISDDNYLTDFTLSNDVADVKNVIHIKVRSQKRGQTSDIWKLTTDLWVPPGETLEFDIETSGTLESIDSIISGVGSGGESRFRAAYLAGYDNGVPFTRKDGKTGSPGGAESKVAISIAPRGSSATVTIKNNSTRAIAMNDGSGKPYMFLWGRVFHDTRFSSGEGVVVSRQDDDSVDAFGANEVELSLDFMTSATLGEALAIYLLYRFADGIDRLEDIAIVGNPLLEIGDRIHVTFARFGIDTAYWIESITDELSPDIGHRQTLVLSVADDGDWFILDSSNLDGAEGLAF